MVSINLTTSHSNLILHHFTTASPISFFLQGFPLVTLNTIIQIQILYCMIFKATQCYSIIIALTGIIWHSIVLNILSAKFWKFMLYKHPKDYTCKSWRKSMNCKSCHPSDHCQLCYTGTISSRSNHSKSLEGWLSEIPSLSTNFKWVAVIWFKW